MTLTRTSEQRGSPVIPAEPSTVRRCVACGYDLFGLGDQPRCPECGLLNIPESFRSQVWELVDSGKWFFSGFFTPFRKRPPGWWWALDRPDDIRKSSRAAARNVVIALSMISLTVVVADSFRTENSYIWTVSYPGGESEEFSRFSFKQGWAGRSHSVENVRPSRSNQPGAGRNLAHAYDRRVYMGAAEPKFFHLRRVDRILGLSYLGSARGRRIMDADSQGSAGIRSCSTNDSVRIAL